MQLDEPVKIVAYDAAWLAMFAQEHVALGDTLAGAIVDIQHIGSTAVAGMTAKPIVDIQAGLKSYPAETSLLVGLEQLGYEYLGEAGVAGRQYLRKRQSKAFNLHLVQHEGEHWRNNLALRDYLRVHADEAQRYAQHKRDALAQAATLLAYSDLKHPFVAELLERALTWRVRSLKQDILQRLVEVTEEGGLYDE
ncbi:MAG TPA: GrpB family protein [Blastocatellia bacterium]|nr:GrpB family protein [Blastocatellia bacterium]